MATRPERRPRDQDRRGRHDAALSFPFGIGTKAVNRFYVHKFSLLLISRPRFLHFTLNHYTATRGRSRSRTVAAAYCRASRKSSASWSGNTGGVNSFRPLFHPSYLLKRSNDLRLSLATWHSAPRLLLPALHRVLIDA